MRKNVLLVAGVSRHSQAVSQELLHRSTLMSAGTLVAARNGINNAGFNFDVVVVESVVSDGDWRACLTLCQASPKTSAARFLVLSIDADAILNPFSIWENEAKIHEVRTATEVAELIVADKIPEEKK